MKHMLIGRCNEYLKDNKSPRNRLTKRIRIKNHIKCGKQLFENKRNIYVNEENKYNYKFNAKNIDNKNKI